MVWGRTGLSQFRQKNRRKRRLTGYRQQMRISNFFLAITFLAMSSAWAGEPSAGAGAAASKRATQPGPLKPGHTAGVQKAQQARAGLALIGAGAIIAVVVVVAGTGSGSGGSAQNNFAPSTTSP
jgi:hypothetical protein